MNPKNLSMNDHLPAEDLTLFQEELGKTDLPNQTYSMVTNEEFLKAIFEKLDGNQCPLVCCFPGHPGKVPSAKWGGNPWKPGLKNITDSNNYFTLASFHPDWAGVYRRRKKTYAAQHALMLDDIGTKAMGVKRLTLPPSWLLETSPGNYQAGYIFSEPIVDGTIAERLMDGIIRADLCDPGAGGPMNRYARLPVGINGKHTPPFRCRLVGWNPERRYSVKDIVDGFGLDFDVTRVEKESLSNWRSTVKRDHSRVYSPSLRGVPVIAKLQEAGIYRRTLGEGAHEITCPWVQEHTDGLDSGTAYFEPSRSYPSGGFSCLHGHCRHRTISHLLEKLGIDENEARNRPTIRLLPGYLFEIIDHLEEELAKVGEFYQRGGLIVIIDTDPGTKAASIRPVNVYPIILALSRHVNFMRFDKRSMAFICCDPPDLHCRILLDAAHYSRLLVLHGIVRQPYLRSDGTLMTKPGYDPDSGLFGLFDIQKFVVPDMPSRKDAEDALECLKSLLDEFRFKTLYDLSAALSAILTAVIRPTLRLAPMFHCRAPQSSSGKSYLASLFCVFATESVPSGVAFPASNEEWRKLLLATLLTSPPVIYFDNLTTDILPYEALCSALTEEYISSRILGVSKTATVSTRTFIVSSGNNVGPVQDMSRRTITIDLDPACEVPAARKFKKDPLEMVLSNRGHYVSQALKIIRGYIVAGKPAKEVPPVATYTEWSDFCRQALIWLDLPDPAKSIFRGMERDPDRETLGRLLHAWHNCFGSRPVMIREAISRGDHALLEVFMDIAGERGNLNNKRLGRWISRHAERIVDGLKFEKDSGTRSAEAWRVESVRSVSSVPSCPDGKNVMPSPSNESIPFSIEDGLIF